MMVTSSRTLRLAPREIDQQVGDELARAVVGDLAAAVDLDHRYADVAQQVLGLAGLAEREHRRMFEQPQFVGSVGAALGGEGLHRTPGRFVFDYSQGA